ncbi:MAG: hypothetical protein AB1499_12135, partial [Nitrospirota bacterium]
SRAPIPYHRDEFAELRISNHEVQAAHINTGKLEFYKHIGIYGYRKEALMKFTALKPCRLERIEKLEQLRALNAGMRIKVKETQFDTFGIDTIEDLRKAEEWQNISL